MFNFDLILPPPAVKTHSAPGDVTTWEPPAAESDRGDVEDAERFISQIEREIDLAQSTIGVLNDRLGELQLQQERRTEQRAAEAAAAAAAEVEGEYAPAIAEVAQEIELITANIEAMTANLDLWREELGNRRAARVPRWRLQE